MPSADAAPATGAKNDALALPQASSGPDHPRFCGLDAKLSAAVSPARLKASYAAIASSIGNVRVATTVGSKPLTWTSSSDYGTVTASTERVVSVTLHAHDRST